MAEAATAEKVAARAVTLKATQEPPLDTFYYGDDVTLPDGRVLKVVYERPSRIMTGKSSALVKTSIVQWYELPIIGGSGESRMLILKTVSQPVELFPDCVYPVAQWNITPERMDGISWVPFWQLREYKDPANPGMNNPIVVPDPVSGRLSGLRCFHYVVVNNAYTPNRLPSGATDDGNWQPAPPVLGSWVINDLKIRAARGRNPTQYARG